MYRGGYINRLTRSRPPSMPSFAPNLRPALGSLNGSDVMAAVVRFRDGKIASFEGFRERGEALEAAGLAI
jgi:hypothetical protein